MIGGLLMGEPRIQVLDHLRHMFGKENDCSLLSQAAFKRYFEKNVRLTKRLKQGDMVFLDCSRKRTKNGERTRGKNFQVETLPKMY